jgi:5-methylcytosine-specific restriction protein A
MPLRPPVHRNPHTANKSKPRLSSAQRGYGGKWEEIRRRVLKRDGWRCQWPGCGKLLVNKGDRPNVDHKKAKADGGTDADDNLWVLCAEHHSRKTASLDGGFGNSRRRAT